VSFRSKSPNLELLEFARIQTQERVCCQLNSCEFSYRRKQRSAVVLAFHNPTIRSLRTIEDFTQTKQAQRHLTIRKVCKSTLSDFNRMADRVGGFIPSNARRHPLLDVPLREILVLDRENGENKQLRLITNLLDVPAAAIAHLYRYRWQIELFFRWLKCFWNFDHLISHSREGVQLYLYVTIIAVMLMDLHTGYRPSKYAFALLGQVAGGAATLDDILPILRERERRNERDRQSRARRRLKKGN